jgi:hypothetical protein
MRAWMHAEENKRRTLQKSDVAAAVSKSDQYDFLIDVVPRDEAGRLKRVLQCLRVAFFTHPFSADRRLWARASVRLLPSVRCCCG